MKHPPTSTSITSAIAVILCAGFLASALAMPTIRIRTKNNEEPGYGSYRVTGSEWGGVDDGAASFPYVAIDTISITGAANSSYNFVQVEKGTQLDSIKIRGNSTAVKSKKPYRLKFDKKRSLFGKEPAKSWVLLASYYDTSLVHNSVVFELGRRMGLKFTPTLEHVNLYINNSYMGVYLLTEQIQVNPGRVDIDPDFGWLAEFDFHKAGADEVRFTTMRYSLPTFIKSPEIEENFTTSNPIINFAYREINAFTDTMYSSRFPTNGYYDYVDVQSFVTYIMIQLFIDNHDFNNESVRQSATIPINNAPGSNYFFKDYGQKIYAGPLWDFDLIGNITWSQSLNPRFYVSYNKAITPTIAFHKRFFDDPVFMAKWKKTWDRHKADFQAMPAFIDSLAQVLQDDNTAKTPGGLASNHAAKISALKTWWNNRITFFDNDVKNRNIDTSKDIEDMTSVAAISPKPINSRKITAARNGLNLKVGNSATVKIYTLDGRQIRAINLKNGAHSVKLDGLPRGMYMANVAVDGEKSTLRIPVR